MYCHYETMNGGTSLGISNITPVDIHEMRSTELAIINSYPTSVSVIIVLLSTKHLTLFMLTF